MGADEMAYMPAETGGEPMKKKGSAVPVILMALFCFLAGCASTLSGINIQTVFTYIKHGIYDALRNMAISFGINLLADCIWQFLGIVLVLVVILVRRKHLSKIKYRDLAVMVVFYVCMGAATALAGVLTSRVLVPFGTAMVAGWSVANAVLGYADAALFVNWVALAVFILARTGAMKASIIVGAAVAGLSMLCSVILSALAVPIVRLLTPSAIVVDYAVQISRVALLLPWVGILAELLAAHFYGRERLGFIPAIIYGPVQAILCFVCTVLAVYLFFFWLKMGLTFASLGGALAYFLGIVYIVLFSLIGKKKA